MSFLRIVSAHKTFTTPEGSVVKALVGISIDVNNNEFLTLLGPSGCGKTTLLNCLAGFEDIDEGDIELEGRSLRGVPAHRRPFNTVFQNYALFPHLNIADNVGYGLDVAGVARKERNHRVDEAMEMVGLSGFGAREPHQLSGGQQQRVALARSLVLKPRVLLLDEPLSALDRKMRETMKTELKSLQNTVGITFIFVTHDQEEALAMSDRIAVLSEGTIQQLDTPAALYNRPSNEFVANFVGTSNIFEGTIVDRAGKFATVETANRRKVQAVAGDFGIGDRVRLLLRPEHFKLGQPDDVENGCAIEGTVKNTLFAGADMNLHVDVGKDRTALVRHRHDYVDAGEAITAGTPVTLHYSPNAAHLIAAEGGSGDRG